MTRLSQISALFLLAISAFAQSDRGTITGTVADPGGAVVPNAAVIATNPATGGLFKTQTTDTGNFTIVSVPAGTYNVSVESAGFRKFEQVGLRVQVSQTSRLDVELQIGATSDSVTVTGDVALLKTENATVSSTVGREQLNQLPLNFAIGAGAVRNPPQLPPAHARCQHLRLEHDSRQRRPRRYL